MKTDIKMNEQDFKKIVNVVENISKVRAGQKKNCAYATEFPEIIGLKLTNRCNLRCKHCYEWSKTGLHYAMSKEAQKEELDLSLVKKIVEEAGSRKLTFYLWGGEPLMYSRFRELTELINPCAERVAVCTNGLLTKQAIHSLLQFGDRLELLLSLDGFEAENDSIRGKGTFQEVVSAIQYLNELKSQGVFQGQVVVSTVINEPLLPRMYDYTAYLESLHIDSLLFCFPWHINRERCEAMDVYYNENFGFLENKKASEQYSWHYYQYGLNESCAGALHEQIKNIRERVWGMRVRVFPSVESKEEITRIIQGESPCSDCAATCVALASRMDVLPDGKVTPCKHFLEFTLGDLNGSGVRELWTSPKYQEMRMKNYGRLMPVCTQCNILYLHNGA